MKGEQFLYSLKSSTCVFFCRSKYQNKTCQSIVSLALDRNLLTLEQIKFVCTTSSKPTHKKYQKNSKRVLIYKYSKIMLTYTCIVFKVLNPFTVNLVLHEDG